MRVMLFQALGTGTALIAGAGFVNTEEFRSACMLTHLFYVYQKQTKEQAFQLSQLYEIRNHIIIQPHYLYFFL